MTLQAWELVCKMLLCIGAPLLAVQERIVTRLEQRLNSFLQFRDSMFVPLHLLLAVRRALILQSCFALKLTVDSRHQLELRFEAVSHVVGDILESAKSTGAEGGQESLARTTLPFITLLGQAAGALKLSFRQLAGYHLGHEVDGLRRLLIVTSMVLFVRQAVQAALNLPFDLVV